MPGSCSSQLRDTSRTPSMELGSVGFCWFPQERQQKKQHHYILNLNKNTQNMPDLMIFDDFNDLLDLCFMPLSIEASYI